MLPGSPYGPTRSIGTRIGISSNQSAIWTLQALFGIADTDVQGIPNTGGIIPVFDLDLGWAPNRLTALALALNRREAVAGGLAPPGHAIATADLALAEAYDPNIILDAGLRGESESLATGTARQLDLDAGITWRIGRLVVLAPHATFSLSRNIPNVDPESFRAMLDLQFIS